MRLRRIEAARYGTLSDATLGDLGDGLTVVYGPNEAGKSSFTSLVRHVLYRYPTARESEQGYAVAGDGRLARLVFDDAAGSWVLERAEGPHGGRLSVRALSGAERPGFAGELTGGVSEEAYKTVFGFGLSEMAAIEDPKVSREGVLAHLYAASAGLRVSPQGVRNELDRQIAELFKPAGRIPPVNKLIAELRQARAKLRDLRAETTAFMGEQTRAREMETQLEQARVARDAARERQTELAVAVERADEKLKAIEAQEVTLAALRRERKRLDDELEAVAPNQALLSAAPEIEALLEEAAGFGHVLQGLGDNEAALARARTRANDALSRTGLSAEALDAFGDAHESAAAIEESRDEIRRLQLQQESRTEAATRADAAAAEAAKELDGELRGLGIAPEAADEIADRLGAIDAIESLRAGNRTDGHHGSVPAVVMSVAGLVALGAGLFLREPFTAGIGAVLVLAGVFFVWRAMSSGGAGVPLDEGQYLRMLGLDAAATPLELARARRALENARGMVTAAATAESAAAAAKLEVESGEGLLAARQNQWAEWLTRKGLDPSLAPAAAASLSTLIHEARSARTAEAEARAALEHATAQADAFVARFVLQAAPFVAVPEAPAREDISALTNRLKESLSAARAADARRAEITREIADLDARVSTETDRKRLAEDDLKEVLARFELVEGGNRGDLHVLLEGSKEDAREATAEYDALAQQLHELEGRLASGARERRTGELHVEEAGLEERLAESVDRYMVLAVASKLLADAQRRYEQERQPEVVKKAGRLFSMMTGGRYSGLIVPLDEGRIEVFDSRSQVRTSDLLSRGTAEQLYLAIRLGLISQLGEVGVGLPVLMDDVLVNFDPERRRGAASAIAELAAERQVVFFTCHPDTAAVFAEVAPQHTRIDLPRLGE